MMDELAKLLSRSWCEYDRLKDRDYVVRPAIPILFFGDSKRYSSSPCKVVTVGLNPSCAEFPDDDRFSRFPNMNVTASDSIGRENLRHASALDSYFRCNPYKRWFATFKPILSGIGCSFYDDRESTALHTDLCSPIATRPTWSRLSRFQRAHLVSEGVGLWHALMRALSPDVILISVAERYLGQIEFRRLGPTRVIWRLDRHRPYEVSATPMEIQPGRVNLLVFGRAANTPFGLISDVKKQEMGFAIKEQFHAASR